MNGHLDMVSVLIAQGSNINAMDQNGWTALHFATKAGHLTVCQLLIESSADPQAETKDGKVDLLPVRDVLQSKSDPTADPAVLCGGEQPH